MAITAMPRRDSSMAELSCISLLFRYPGAAMTRGTLFSGDASRGTKRSPAIHLPLPVGTAKVVTRTFPKPVWRAEAPMQLTSIRTMAMAKIPRAFFVVRPWLGVVVIKTHSFLSFGHTEESWL